MLEGFDSMEPAKLVVAKKLIGLCAKKHPKQWALLIFLMYCLKETMSR